MSMKDVVRAASVQFNIALAEVDINLARASAAIERLADRGAELAVLPEMWSTGYSYKHLSRLAEQSPRVIEALCRLSEKHSMVLVGSLAEKQGDCLYNTAAVIDGGRLAGSYRKLHLFSTMGEDRFLCAGDELLVADTRLGKIGVAICYDLRFPELFRRLALNGAEILCIPAEWPKPRQEHWRTLLKARAIENQLFVVAANCCGLQGKLDFFGLSQIISARGDILAEAQEAEGEILAELHLEQMLDSREHIPCFKDRRPEIYGDLS